MVFFSQFVQTYLCYIRDMWFWVALGFLLSGIIYQFIPENLIEKYLGGRGLKPIFLSSLIGATLPICCFGTLPVAMTLRKKGARLGPVLAFLVTTPATSVSALIVTYKFLGLSVAVYLFFVVIVLGMVMGIIGNLIAEGEIATAPAVNSAQGESECCCAKEKEPDFSVAQKIRNAFIYAFVTLPKQIGRDLLLGIAVASFVMVCVPLQELMRHYLSGALGFAFVLAFGLVDYVCSTASVPIADAFIKSGLTPGHAVTYLIVGPVTSYGTILVINRQFGKRVLVAYLLTISILSVVFGVIYNYLHL